MKIKTVLLTLIIFAISSAAPSAFGQKTNPGAAKAELVRNLVEITITSFPTQDMQISFRKEVDKVTDAEITENSDIIRPVLEKSESFSAEEKTKLLNNLPSLAAILARQVNSAVIRELKFEEWTRTSLAANYSKKFTVAELNRLIAYFQTDTGKLMLESVNINLKNIFDSDQNSDDVVSNDENAPFIVSTTGKKFVEIVYESLIKDIVENTVPSKKEQAESVGKVMKAHGDENINKLLSKYLRENSEN